MISGDAADLPMKRQRREKFTAILTAGFLLIVFFAHSAENNVEWPNWRGPSYNGVAENADPPVEWSEEKNVRWKTPLPGLGHSSPVVTGNRIFVTAAIPGKEPLPSPKRSGRPGAHDNAEITHSFRFVVLAIDRSEGGIVWETTVDSGIPHEGGHVTASLASASPVADKDHIIAFFGSRGLYCMDHEGTLLWKTDLGEMHTKHGHGEGSSPVLHGETVVVNWDHQEESFIVAFDKSTGREKWRESRDEKTSWSSPIVVTHEGAPQVIVSATGALRSYDLETGEVIWECGGLSDNVVASPVSANGIVIAGSSYNKRSMIAVKMEGATGDITGTSHVLWRRINRTPYVPSPLLYENTLYFLAHYQGVLSRVDPVTGKDRGGPFRLEGLSDIYASPVAAAGRIYITDRQLGTLVLSHTSGEDPPGFLAMNQLDDRISASAAIVDRELFLRGEKFLYCLAEE